MTGQQFERAVRKLRKTFEGLQGDLRRHDYWLTRRQRERRKEYRAELRRKREHREKTNGSGE